jgi:lipopolysaccharide export LptBFGC system permease protein LptF
MDANTLDYYDRINDYFSPVLIVQDTEVKENSTLWRNAYENADLVFITSLSDDMLNTSRDEFCESLSILLTQIKGIVFAGNSSIVSDSIYGCLYTPYFNLAVASNNTELRSDSVKLIESHKITEGYIIDNTYHVRNQDSIYTIVNPVGAIILGTVNGDPDGSGPMPIADYPFLVVWEGTGHRTAVWGINTSMLTGCTNCLGWKLFDQLLKWVSETKDIGYKIFTDRETYYPEEIINIDVKSPANMSEVTGTIHYPDGTKYALYFTGSGKEWHSIYLLNKEDPNGNYTIEVIADSVKKSKTIYVNAFDLNININNQTRNVTISISVTDKYGSIVNVDLTVNITSPKGETNNYYFENDGSVSLSHYVKESGEYTLSVNAIDAYGRSLSKTERFSFRFRPNITFIPENITEVVYGPINLTKMVSIFNDGSDVVTNVNITKSGVIEGWIELENTSLGEIQPNESKILRFNVSVPDVEKGEYTGVIKFLFDSEEYVLSINILMKYPGNLSVEPKYWRGWFLRGQSKTIQFFLSNSGRGEVVIESISVSGDLKERTSIVEQPSKIDPGMNESLKLEIRADVMIEDLTEELSGNLKIVTDQGVYYPLISLRVTVVKDLREEADRLSQELEGLESNITLLEKTVDVSTMKNSLMNIRSDLNRVRNLYSQENYEDAVTLYESVESDVEKLKTDVLRTHTEIEKKKEMYKRIIIIFLVLVVVVLIAVLLFRKISRERKYAWLYKKWKR